MKNELSGFALAKVITGKKLLIFDFDGTIADTSHLHAQAFSEVLAPLAISVGYQQIAGMRTDDAIKYCFSKAKMPQPSVEELHLLVSAKQRCVRDLISVFLEPLPGMDAFLRWAKTRFLMALVTSGSRETVSLALDKLGYDSTFQAKIFAEDVKFAKPDPEGFMLALQAFSCMPEDALVFEDSTIGFKAAARANIDCIDISNGDFALISRM